MRFSPVAARLWPGLLAGCLLAACHRADPAPAAPVVTADYDATASPTVVAQPYAAPPPTKPLGPEYAFDLDNALVMPAPAGATPIPAPWAPGAGGSYSADLRNDHHRADGWELLYTMFSTQAVPGTPYFVLYNQFRGVVRLYYYVPAWQSSASYPTYVGLASTITLGGAQQSATPLLNFAAQPVVSTTQAARLVSSLDAQPISNSAWFITQFELAYDPAIRSRDWTKLYFSWELNACEVQSLRLGDLSLRNVPVSVQAPGGNFAAPGSWGSIFRYEGPLLLTLTGPASAASLQQAGLPATGAQRVLGAAADAPWYAGVVPTAPDGTGALAYLPTTGQVTTNASLGLTSLNLVPPGYDNTATTGFAPQYNAAPGVFFLQEPPVVRVQPAAGSYVYRLDVSSVKYLFNPAVQAVADVQHLRQELVATLPDGDLAGPTYHGTTLTASQELRVQGVRVSFDVVPRNGSAPVHVTKTFAATLR